jgi:hypothetical protein
MDPEANPAIVAPPPAKALGAAIAGPHGFMYIEAFAPFSKGSYIEMLL